MSCLFNSLSFFSPDDSYTLIMKPCDYLASNPILMDDMNAELVVLFDSGLLLSEYVNRMRSTSTWGGAIEIKAFCNMFGKNVFVRNIRDRAGAGAGDRNKNIIEFISPGIHINNVGCDADNFHVTWSGGHYEPVR